MSQCPFHEHNDGNIDDCYYCRMHWSKVRLTYLSAPWSNVPEGEYEDGIGIPVTPTIDRSEE